MLSDNRDKLNKLAEILLLKEVIFREDLEKIFGKRPFPDHDHVMINSNGDTNEYRQALPSAEPASETTASETTASDTSHPAEPEITDKPANPNPEIPA